MNIASLVQTNKLTSLRSEYQENRLIRRLKEEFSEEEENMFVSSFYLYLNYDSKKDFIIDLDKVWKWLGFVRKGNAKRLLEKYFEIETDYKVENLATAPTVARVEKTASPFGEAVVKNKVENLATANAEAVVKKNGGQNFEKVIMTVNTFKKFCLKAGTKKADKVHDYYIRLEEVLQEIIKENFEVDLRAKEIEIKKLENKVQSMQSFTRRSHSHKGKCVYVGINEETYKGVFKVGKCDNVAARESTLSSGTPGDFKMVGTWYTRYNEEVEKLVQDNFQDALKSVKKKELFDIKFYDEICNFISKLVECLCSLDRFPQETQGYIEPTVLPRLGNREILPEKVCNMCYKTKKLECYYDDVEYVDGKENTCKECCVKRQAAFIEEKRRITPVPTEKACSQCKEVLPLTDFYVDNVKFDRRSVKCKECFKKSQSRGTNVVEVSEYKCCKCLEVKPIEDFYKSRNTSTGHAYSCKVCSLKEVKEYYQTKKAENSFKGMEPPKSVPTGVVGVTCRNNIYKVDMTINGRRYTKSFAITKWGQERAFEEAVKHRKYLEGLLEESKLKA